MSRTSSSSARPVIGVTLDRVDDKEQYMSPFTYAEAIQKAGGLPMLLPYRAALELVPMYLDQLDGVLFTGGNDLDPTVYGQTFHPRAVPVDPPRQSFEAALLAEVERRRVPALGVCMGMQLMNVHRAGSLHQFLPDLAGDSPLEHRFLKGQRTRHDVSVDTNSRLGAVLGAPIVSVNTYHKQAVHRLGRNLKIVATSPDGVIEGFEDDSLPLFAAVQWHPERLLDEPAHLAPFKLLIDTAARARA